MDTIKKAFEVVQERAAKDGAEVELLFTGAEKLSLRFQKQKLQAFDSSQSQMAGLRVLFDNQQGYAYTERLDEEALLRTYQDAFENSKTVKKPGSAQLKLTGPKKFNAMPLLAIKDEVPMEEKLAAATDVEALCYKKDKRIEGVPYCAFVEIKGFKRILNSKGVDQAYESSAYTAYAYPLAKEGESSKMMNNSISVRRFSELNVDRMVSQAVADVVSLLNAEKLKTGIYPVVIRGDQASKILSMISGYFSAKSVYENNSLFKEKLNQQVASEQWTLLDDPTDSKGFGARPFDDEGTPSQRTVLIENGVLKSFISNLEYSEKMQIPLTAHACRAPSSEMGIAPTNLFVKPGSQTRAQLLETYPETVFITHFTAGLYSSYNETTGEISMPCEGILYQNGKPVKAVEQFILSINVLDLMKQTEALSDSYMDSSSEYFCPDILVKPISLVGS